MNHSTWKGSHYESGLRYGATLYERRINLMEHLTVDRARLDYAQAAIDQENHHGHNGQGRSLSRIVEGERLLIHPVNDVGAGVIWPALGQHLDGREHVLHALDNADDRSIRLHTSQSS